MESKSFRSSSIWFRVYPTEFCLIVFMSVLGERISFKLNFTRQIASFIKGSMSPYWNILFQRLKNTLMFKRSIIKFWTKSSVPYFERNFNSFSWSCKLFPIFMKFVLIWVFSRIILQIIPCNISWPGFTLFRPILLWLWVVFGRNWG